jgi:hypothetical protein
MIRLTRRTGLAVAAALLGAVTLTFAAPAPETTTDVIKERTGFIPQRKYQPLPGKTIGVLVSNVVAMMGQEGRGGPADAFGFSRDGQSYRWVYVPVQQNPMINNLQVNVGEKGEKIKVYPSLSMASPTTVKQWDIDVPFALVEVEVNDQLGSPAQEGFVGTKMKRLDGAKEYSLQVAEVVAEVQKKHQRLMQEQEKAIGNAMAEAEKQYLKDKKMTGPRETNEIMYMTWLPETERLRINFRTTISDGAFQMVEGAPFGRPVPLPLPPNRKGKIDPGFGFFPPPPPPVRPAFRTGTVVGIEMGYAFEVTKSGKIDRILTLPIQSFTRELPPAPGGILPRGGPRQLPPQQAPLEG